MCECLRFGEDESALRNFRRLLGNTASQVPLAEKSPEGHDQAEGERCRDEGSDLVASEALDFDRAVPFAVNAIELAGPVQDRKALVESREKGSVIFADRETQPHV